MSEINNLDKLTPAPLPERFMAALIDFVIVVGLCMFPRVGWILALIYHLTRDSSKFLKGQSFGKKLMNLKVVTFSTRLPLTGSHEKAVIRGIVALIPVLNMVDIWFLITKGYRLADKWADTSVVVYKEPGN